MFCKHNWKLIAQTYAPSLFELRTTSVKGGVTEAQLQGQTTLLWECQNCQALRKETMLGKAFGLTKEDGE